MLYKEVKIILKQVKPVAVTVLFRMATCGSLMNLSDRNHVFMILWLL